MTQFFLYSEVNILCIAILTIIALDIRKSEFNHGMRPVLLSKYIGFAAIFSFLDFLGEIPVAAYLPWVVSHILSSVYFLSFGALSYYWFSYAEIIHNRNHLNNTKWRIISAVPVFVLALLHIVSYFNGCLFSFDGGVFKRGALYLIQPVILLGYIFASLVRCIYYVPKALSVSKRRDLLNFIWYSAFTLTCGLLQFALGRFSILVIGITVTVTIIYLDYTGKLISNDPLTGIPNRRKLMHYLTEEIQQLKTDEDLWFMFADIDHFKQINDKFGHMEGDRILKEITIAMKEFCKENHCFCARFGGDEFAVVQKLKYNLQFSVPDDLQDFIDKKNILVNNKYKLTASLGYTKFSRDDYTVNDMIKRADKEMYRAKMEKTSNFFFGG